MNFAYHLNRIVPTRTWKRVIYVLLLLFVGLEFFQTWIFGSLVLIMIVLARALDILITDRMQKSRYMGLDAYYSN